MVRESVFLQKLQKMSVFHSFASVESHVHPYHHGQRIEHWFGETGETSPSQAAQNNKNRGGLATAKGNWGLGPEEGRKAPGWPKTINV